MRVLLAFLVLVSFHSADAATLSTQYLRCQWDRDVISVEISLNGRKPVAAEVTYRGQDLTPGLYRGQYLGGEAVMFTEIADKRFVGLVGGGTDPSSDNPYSFRLSFPKSLLGRSMKRGQFPLYFEHMDNVGSYSGEAKDILQILLKKGVLHQNPTQASAWGAYCWSYVKRAQ